MLARWLRLQINFSIFNFRGFLVVEVLVLCIMSKRKQPLEEDSVDIVPKISARLKNDDKFCDSTFRVGSGDNIKVFRCMRGMYVFKIHQIGV